MVFAAPDTTSSGAAYALCHPQQSPSPSPSSGNPQSGNPQSDESSVHPDHHIHTAHPSHSSQSPHSAFPIPHSDALPSTAEIDALATLEDLNRPAQIIHYLESRLQDWAVADPASRPPDLAKLNSFTMLFSRVNTARKNTLARREAILAEQKTSSPPPSKIPHSEFRIPHSDDAASFIPDPVDPAPDWSRLRSLRAWLREMFVSGHFGALDQVLRLCCFEAWEDLQRNDPEKARKIMTCWPYPDSREPPYALLRHWLDLHSPEYLSERYTLLHGVNNEGYGVSWFAGGEAFTAWNREPDPFRANSSAGILPASTPAPSNTPAPSPNPDPLDSEVSTSDAIPAEVESDLTPNEAPLPNPPKPDPPPGEPVSPWPPPPSPLLFHRWRNRARPGP